MPSPPLAEAAWPNAAAGEWPSYNRTPTSQRFSPLDQINAKNVGNLKIQCIYELGEITAFESGLIMVNNALIGATEFDIFSINPTTCAENWRTHLDYPPGLLPSNRGVAYMGPGKVEVQNIDFPSFELQDGPGVNPAERRPPAAARGDPEGRLDEYLRLRPAHGARSDDGARGPHPRARDHG